MLASGAYDGTICEWNATTDLAEPLRSLPGHSDAAKKECTNVSCLAYRDDGALLSGGWDGEVRIWTEGKLHARFSAAHSEAVWCVMPFGDHVVSGGADKALRVWDVTKLEAAGDDERAACVGEVKVKAAVRGVVPHGEGGLLVVGNDGWIRTFSGALEPLDKHQAHPDSYIYGVARCPRSNAVVYTVAEDRTLKAWGTEDWTCLHECAHPAEAWAVATHPENGDVVVACGDKCGYVWTRDSARAGPASAAEELQERCEMAVPVSGQPQSATQAALRRKLQKKNKKQGQASKEQANSNPQEQAAAEAAALAAQAALLAELELEDNPAHAQKGPEGKKKKKKKQ